MPQTDLPSPARIEAALTAPGAPFEVVRTDDGSPQYASGPRTLREFAETVWAFGDQPFLISDTGTRTYGEFFAEASALARRFLDEDGYGLAPGDRAVMASVDRKPCQSGMDTSHKAPTCGGTGLGVPR